MSLWTFRIEHAADTFDCAAIIVEADTKEEAIAIVKKADAANERKRKSRKMDWIRVIQWEPDRLKEPFYVDQGYNY